MLKSEAKDGLVHQASNLVGLLLRQLEGHEAALEIVGGLNPAPRQTFTSRVATSGGTRTRQS